MRDIWLVVKHDIGATLRQRSFWVLTMLMPLLLMAFNAFSILQLGEANGTDPGAAEQKPESDRPFGLPAIGLVDEANLMVETPPGFPADLFARFPDEASAHSALEAGQIEQYVYIPADYIATGQVTVYQENFQLLVSGENMGVAFGSNNEWLLPYIIDYNLVGDEQLFNTLQNPVPAFNAEHHALRPAPEPEIERQELAELVASVMPYAYYFLLIMGGNYLMRAVVSEKENRTAEVLLLSLSPRKLMVGKILAMSVVTLIQVIVWVGGGMLILNRGAALLNAAQFTFPPGFAIWATLFLIFGYLVYASIMAAVGAIAPNTREGGQAIWLLILPLMPALMFGPRILEEPDGMLSMVLSLFPLSAPAAMVTRLAVATVPLWQILASLAALALTAYLFVTLAARFFRADNLLSDEAFNLRRLATGWRKP